MSMTVVVTRNAPGRFRGYLASCMCEIAPGVYTAPTMTVAVRDRVWRTLESWWALGSDVGLVMTWSDAAFPGGQAIRILGCPATELVDLGAAHASRRDLPDALRGSLDR